MASAARPQVSSRTGPTKVLNKPFGRWERPGRSSRETTTHGPCNPAGSILKTGTTGNARPLSRTAVAAATAVTACAPVPAKRTAVPVASAAAGNPHTSRCNGSGTTRVQSAETRGVKCTSAPTASPSTFIRTAKTAAAPTAGRAAPRPAPKVASSSSRAAPAIPVHAPASRVAPTAASRTGTARVAPAATKRAATSTTSRASPSAATSTASCSSSSSSSYDIELPLVLDPRRPNPDAVLLKDSVHPWDSAVWMIQRGGQLLVVKQTPYHSPEHFLHARRVLIARGNKHIDIFTEALARREAATVVQLPGIFVQPLLVRDREYTRDAGDEACPDREVLIVTPYFPSGDAGQYIAHVATPLIAALAAGKLSLDAVVKELVRKITCLSRAMLTLVSQVHLKGFILIDHKLENMVYDHVLSRWQLIDAEEVQRGSILTGPCRHTPGYAAPEQKRGRDPWADPRSDVFTCGRCIQMAVSDCLDRLTAALGEGTKALTAAEAAFREALLPLTDVATRCGSANPAARPTAAAALRDLRAAGMQ